MLSALLSNQQAVDPSAARLFVEAYLSDYNFPMKFDLSGCFPEDAALSTAMDTAMQGGADIWKFLDAWKAIDTSI